MTSPDQQVGTELERVVRRWQQLPLDRALPAVPTVHAAVQALADGASDAQGLPRDPVPDLGPAVLMDQLRVMVYDWRAAGLDEDELAARLTELRRSLP
ncbi:hypothetical protein GCM10009584_16240 [Ornithinimicrobium humiphilum]|uniref:Uncharacterized protein n=1 Tax=Ornithinimicrobium humiphilum TaxID=125288 RepID=A0A543KKW3_9MICO|nr:hypothetical protein [Ornithinimicrobium humiphilum]TQM95717.1 hypothetical protein FB476_0567 [Ornithinimicrobium humiphilum]